MLKYIVDYHSKIAAAGRRLYKVVQIWPGLFTLVYIQISPGHIWTTLYVGVGWNSVCLSVCASCWPSSMEGKIVHISVQCCNCCAIHREQKPVIEYQCNQLRKFYKNMILVEEFRSGVLHELTRRDWGEWRQKIVYTPDLAFNNFALRPQSVFMGRVCYSILCLLFS